MPYYCEEHNLALCEHGICPTADCPECYAKAHRADSAPNDFYSPAYRKARDREGWSDSE